MSNRLFARKSKRLWMASRNVPDLFALQVSLMLRVSEMFYDARFDEILFHRKGNFPQLNYDDWQIKAHSEPIKSQNKGNRGLKI